MGNLELKDLLKWVLAIGLILFLLSFVLIWNGFHRGETGPTDQRGGQTGGLCNNVPLTYQVIFTSSARGSIPPALLAGIFSVEHGKPLEYEVGYTPTSAKNDIWPEQSGNPNKITKWEASNAGAQGPFQFMPTTWTQYGKGGNVQNITDAALGASNMLLANYNSNSGTHNEKLKKAIARYNPGAGPWNNSRYVDKVWKAYQSFLCTTGGQIVGGQLDVPFIKQAADNYCGRASQAMVIAFFDIKNLAKYQDPQFQLPSNMGLKDTTVQDYTKKNYHWANPSLDEVINSINKGFPAIVYTDLYGQHIFVLTGYDESTQTFWANDTFIYRNGVIPKGVQSINGVKLTKDNLQKHLEAQNGHTFLYVP